VITIKLRDGTSVRAETRHVPAALGLAVVAAMILSACGSSHGKSVETTNLRVVRSWVVRDAGPPVVRYTGTVRAHVESDLGFRVGGKITERLVDAGQTVRKGQPLMRLDPVDLGLAATAARQRLIATEADATRAAADEARLRGLVAEGAISQTVYDAALAQQRSTAAAVDAARAADHEALLQRDYSTLIADADGVVMEVLAQPGQVVAAGTPIVRLGRAGTREALVAVPEEARSTLRREGEAVLYGANARYHVVLRELGEAADSATRTFPARYTLSGAAASAPLGTTVTVELQGSAIPTVVVPLAALYDAGSGPQVWVIDDGHHVHKRQVIVTALGEETASLAREGLRTGEQVVALGASLLREGETVRVQSANMAD
jgi:RND family efflux transporter MFP subunit